MDRQHLLLPLKLLGVIALCLGVLMLVAWLLRPDLAAPLPAVDAADLARVEALRDITYPDEPPVLWQDVDYAAGPAAAWYPKAEAPLLAELVAEGKLPPVAERTGSQPLVLAGVDGPGSYGGTWFRVASSSGDTGVMGWRMSGATLVRWSPLGPPVVPHIARSWEVNEDDSVYTFHLREGARWSDGAPLTTEDVRYWWEDHTLGIELDEAGQPKGQVPQWLCVGDEPGRIEIVDTWTFRYVFPRPYPLFLQILAKQHGWCAPAHYLRSYHPRDDIGDRAAKDREKERRGTANDRVLYNSLQAHDNVHHPRLWPWIYRTEVPDSPYVWVRNPYYYAVDSAGQQLPYLDQVQFAVKQSQFVAIAASQGEISMQRRDIKFQDYGLLMKKRFRADGTQQYEIHHWYPASRSEYTVFPNMNRRVDPGDTHAMHKQRLLDSVDFRRALSLAIDRATIIDAFYFGQTEAAQLDPGPDSPFHSPELYHAAIDYAPAEANRLLDGLGLTRRDGEGMRSAPDGTRLTFYLNLCEWTGPGPGPFLIQDWQRVGIRVIIRDRARALWNAEKKAYQQDLTVWSGESEFLPLLEPRNFVPTGIESFYAPAFGVWYSANALSGRAEDLDRAHEIGGIAPDPEDPGDAAILANMRDFKAIQQAESEQRQRQLWQRIAARAAENIWTISVCTHPPQPVVVRTGLRGVPRKALDGAGFYTPGNAGIETFWWDPASEAGQQAQLSAAASVAFKQQMLTISDRWSSVGVAGGVKQAHGVSVGTILVTLFWGSLALATLLVAVRHPFVARRLLIMVPTLLIISVVGFVVIQLPPGDFLETRIAELKLRNDETAQKQVEELQEMFRSDESAVVKYCRWMGFTWFVTYQKDDRGLLQGFLGYSMEDGKPVNDLVGDRIVLTMAISIMAILLTWSIALVTGTYSAVRQYSKGDYLLTFISFIGMSVPNFLLALVLIYLADVWFGISVTGLFSPQYAAQSHWSWGKFGDLLSHIWVPVLIAGIGGTAGLFRVMRGNLLDELRKPYVTTARAKGVRPLPLLVKYPVRVALNPVISTIGHIFPELVSGSAIVAIVLSLPTVGPLMLSALLMEDMYLAGSMLMVLSLLGIFGTLVSDLLLLWLDPRIRMGKR